MERSIALLERRLHQVLGADTVTGQANSPTHQQRGDGKRDTAKGRSHVVWSLLSWQHSSSPPGLVPSAGETRVAIDSRKKNSEMVEQVQRL
jgi:hypothetical protein